MKLKRRIERLEQAGKEQRRPAVRGLAFVWAETETSIEWPVDVPPAPLAYPLQQSGLNP